MEKNVAQKNPETAAKQVWRYGGMTQVVERVSMRTEGGSVPDMVTFHGGGWSYLVDLRKHCKCIGIETDRGRVEFLGEVDGMRSVPKPDPRVEREARRREIDAILREDARKHPAFATARKCAVVAMFEGAPPFPSTDYIDDIHVGQWLVNLRDYEDLRGVMREPSDKAKRYAQGNLHDAMVAVYERSRALP